MLTVAHQIAGFGGEFERTKGRVGTQFVGRVLIDGLASPNIGAFGSLGENAIEPSGVSAGMHATALMGANNAEITEAAEHCEIFPKGLKRLQDWRELEVRPSGGRMEVGRIYAVRNIEKCQPAYWIRRRSKRGNHGIKQRQGYDCARSSQESPPRKRLLRNEHSRVSPFT